MKNDVNQLIVQCNNELSKLPAPLTLDPATEILNRVAAFCHDLKGAVDGNRTTALARQNRERYGTFKNDIRATAPDFRPYHDEEHVAGPIQEHEPGDEILTPAPGVETLDLLDIREVIAE